MVSRRRRGQPENLTVSFSASLWNLWAVIPLQFGRQKDFAQEFSGKSECWKKCQEYRLSSWNFCSLLWSSMSQQEERRHTEASASPQWVCGSVPEARRGVCGERGVTARASPWMQAPSGVHWQPSQPSLNSLGSWVGSLWKLILLCFFIQHPFPVTLPEILFTAKRESLRKVDTTLIQDFHGPGYQLSTQWLPEQERKEKRNPRKRRPDRLFFLCGLLSMQWLLLNRIFMKQFCPNRSLPAGRSLPWSLLGGTSIFKGSYPDTVFFEGESRC